MVDLPAEALFSKAASQLERIAELKQKNLVNETEYQELRSQLLNQLKQAAGLGSVKMEKQPLAREEVVASSPPYGLLHMQIVRNINAHYETAEEDPKKQMRKAINEMAEAGALHPGDPADIEEMVEIVTDPFFESPAGNTREAVIDKVLSSVISLSNVRLKIVNKPNSSPAVKAIAEVTLQSAGEAAEKIRTHQQTPQPVLWKKLVLPDLKGALEGGAAAVTIAPAFTPFFPLSLPIAAAFGVIVGGGIGSGMASAEVGRK